MNGFKRLCCLLLTLCMMCTMTAAMAEDEATCEHSWALESISVDPTCVEEGTGVYFCVICYERKEDAIPVLDHSMVLTCNADGHWEYCSNCGGQEQPLEAHIWTDPVVLEEASCTGSGIIAKNCTVCGYTNLEIIDIKEHTWGEFVVVYEPDCVNTGKKVRTCSVCQATQEEIIPPIDPDNGHNWVYTYVNDSVHHGYCAKCGSSFESNHRASCTTMGVCVDCGAAYSGASVTHRWAEEYTHDETMHWMACTECGAKGFYEQHVTRCTDPNTCVYCGYSKEGLVSYMVHQGSATGGMEHDAQYHWAVGCTACGGDAGTKYRHAANCANPNVCTGCGATDVDCIVYHNWDDFESSHDPVTHLSTCPDCGQTFSDFMFEGAITREPTCTTDGYRDADCSACGPVRITIPATGHSWKVTSETAPTCTEAGTIVSTCENCGETKTEAGAAALGHSWKVTGETAPTCTKAGTIVSTCENCGETKTEAGAAALGHTWKVTGETAPTCTEAGTIVSTCTACGETKTEAGAAALGHTWEVTNETEATCTEAGVIESTCTACGETKTEAGAAALGHSWKVTAETAPTCTEAGSRTNTCEVCGEEETEVLAALGHDYDVAFTSQHDGTHAVTCHRCGNKRVEACNLVSTEIGDMVCSACATCGYAVYTLKDTIALPDADGAQAEIQVTRVENAVIAAVDEAAPMDEDVVLIVHETVLEMTIQLPEAVKANVKKAIAVTLVKENTSIQPSGKVRLSIPCEEAEMAGLKLVLMGEDGELIEIEYEIIDGMIVFETETVGVFLLLEAAE